MNPYLEQNDTWEDLHHNFMTRAREALSPRVGPNYIVKIEVRRYLHELPAEERSYRSRMDFVVNPGPIKLDSPAGGFVVQVQLEMPPVDIERHASLEIRDIHHRRLVTAVDLLSPSHKTFGAARDDYFGNRARLLAQRVNLVEIDLRRGGERPRPPELPPCDYYVLVARSRDWPRLDFWPIGLRDRLPVVPVPLAAPDADVPLDLQGVLDRAYDAADYGKYIYAETPEPPLSDEDAAWARSILRPAEGCGSSNSG
jgi:hypothetical protein